MGFKNVETKRKLFTRQDSNSDTPQLYCLETLNMAYAPLCKYIHNFQIQIYLMLKNTILFNTFQLFFHSGYIVLFEFYFNFF